MMAQLIFLIVSVVASLLLTRHFRQSALNSNLLDIPNKRSSHTVPVPRGGGMVIVLVFTIGLIYLYLKQNLDEPVLIAFVGTGWLVAVIGFWDDHGSIAPVWRLIAHFLAAIWGLLWLSGVKAVAVMGQDINLTWLGYVLLAIALVWLLNLFNFMDGIDGIAASEAIFVACSGYIFAVLSAHTGLQLVAVILVGSTLGFLYWNWPPAKIFMGDAGSGFLGGTLGMYAIWSAKDDVVTFWTWAIIMGVFLVDATFTLIRRILRKQRWYAAHRCHAYQHAAQRWGHLPVTLAVTFINIFWLLPIAYFSNQYREMGPGLMILALTPLIVLAFILGAGKETLE